MHVVLSKCWYHSAVRCAPVSGTHHIEVACPHYLLDTKFVLAQAY